jgi:hypothetical protein
LNENIRQLAEKTGLWEILSQYSWEFGNCDAEKDCGDALERFAMELVIANAEAKADELKQMKSNDLVNRPFELDSKFIKLCALNAPRRRQTYDDQDFQDLVDIDGKSIPHVSKLRKQKKDKE